MKLNAFILSGFLFLIISSVTVYSQDSGGISDTLYNEISARLLVKDREQAADDISLWAEEKGGYFTEKTLDRLVLRIPDRNIEELKSLLGSKAEEVLDFSQYAYDLRESLMSAQSSLSAKEDLLKRNTAYLDQSDLEGTLTLELEIRRLMKEIDHLKGSIRKMENDRTLARVELLLSFKNQTIPDGRPSRFDWINTVDFYSFINSSPTGAERGRKGPQLPLPGGFALSSERPWFQALSPEGVRIRLRKFNNYPRQTEAFWATALFTRLEGLGYIPVDAENRELDMDGGDPFSARSWGVPLGNKDYIYLTALRLKGENLEILEIAGEAEYVKEYF